MIKIRYELHLLTASGEWKGFKGFVFDNENDAFSVLDVLRSETDGTWRLVKITEEVIA